MSGRGLWLAVVVSALAGCSSVSPTASPPPGLIATPTPITQVGAFSPTGSMIAGRQVHTATSLSNGRVLIAGGMSDDGSVLASAELYDPTSGTFTPTGTMTAARYGHTATLLPNGRVLIAGGGNESGALASAELYDPGRGTFTAARAMTAARIGHTATLLMNGRVLVAGGEDGSRALASAEVYDPGSGTFTPTGDLAAAGAAHTATLLMNGRVLVAGGRDFFSDTVLASAELYDPARGTFTLTGAMNAIRQVHTATLLPNGRVLIAGGTNSTGNSSNGISQALALAELYDPTGGTFTPTGAMTVARSAHMATLLQSGRVLIAGGGNVPCSSPTACGNELASAELYDPASGNFAPTGDLIAARAGETATLLPNGSVLIAGGRGSTGALASAELFQ